MAFCELCGMQLEAGTAFCPNCGARQTPAASQEPPQTPAPAQTPNLRAPGAEESWPTRAPGAERAAYAPVPSAAPAAPAQTYAPVPPAAPAYAAPQQPAHVRPLEGRKPSGASRALMTVALILALLQIVMLFFLPVICRNPERIRSAWGEEYNAFSPEFNLTFHDLTGGWQRLFYDNGLDSEQIGWYTVNLSLGVTAFGISLALIVLLSKGANARRGKVFALISAILAFVQTGLFVSVYFLMNTNQFKRPIPDPPVYLFTVFGYIVIGLTFSIAVLAFIRLFLKDRRQPE